MERRPTHPEGVRFVERRLRRSGFVVLTNYSVRIMDTDTALTLAFAEEYRRARGEEYERIVPVVNPDLLAEHPKLGRVIVVPDSPQPV